VSADKPVQEKTPSPAPWQADVVQAPDPDVLGLQQRLQGLGLLAAPHSGQFTADTQAALATLAAFAGQRVARDILEAAAQVRAVEDRIDRRRPVAVHFLIPPATTRLILVMLDGDDLDVFKATVRQVLHAPSTQTASAWMRRGSNEGFQPVGLNSS